MIALMTTAQQTGMIPSWTLGDRLRKAREVAGISQAELARAIAVSRNTVSNAEGGRVAPRQIVLNAWSLATGVPLAWIQHGEAANEQPRPDGPDGAVDVRHQGLEPRTRWLTVSADHSLAATA